MAKLIHENGGTLSKKKRRSLFSDLDDNQVAAAEKAVVDAMNAHGVTGEKKPAEAKTDFVNQKGYEP